MPFPLEFPSPDQWTDDHEEDRKNQGCCIMAPWLWGLLNGDHHLLLLSGTIEIQICCLRQPDERLSFWPAGGMSDCMVTEENFSPKFIIGARLKHPKYRQCCNPTLKAKFCNRCRIFFYLSFTRFFSSTHCYMQWIFLQKYYFPLVRSFLCSSGTEVCKDWQHSNNHNRTVYHS